MSQTSLDSSIFIFDDNILVSSSNSLIQIKAALGQTNDLFLITANDGTTKYFYVDKDGTTNISSASFSNSISVTGDSNSESNIILKSNLGQNTGDTWKINSKEVGRGSACVD